MSVSSLSRLVRVRRVARRARRLYAVWGYLGGLVCRDSSVKYLMKPRLRQRAVYPAVYAVDENKTSFIGAGSDGGIYGCGFMVGK